jgi:chondroitin AC lyase
MHSATRIFFPFVAAAFLLLSFQPKPDDFGLIKSRVVAEVMKTGIDDSGVEAILGRMNKDGSYPDINYDDLSRTAGFPHRRHTQDLLNLAKAYKSRKSKYFKSRNLKDRITASLQFWVDHDFFGDNWHDNQITTPTNLVHLMLVIGNELPAGLVEKAQPIIGRAHMNASGARPSGDRIVIAGILAKNFLFTGNRAEFEEIIKLIEGEIKFNTGERGMQHDFSFHHREDRVNNTTSYGYGKYANAFGEWSYYVANTRHAFSVEKINHLVDYYLDGVYKQLVYGIYEDISVKNRSISQKATFKPQEVTEIERLLVSTDYRKNELEEIIRLRKGEKQPSQSFATFFWQTEHFVFQRPDFYTTVRMFSTRNRNMEEPYNGPGKTTHHRADGTNYLMLKGDEYHNIWPVYDWQKISGTTILQKPALPGPDQIQMDGLTDFVGAVTDGLYGAVAFDFRSPHDMTKAKKSWFFFDEEYVCLGTGIKADTRLPVATTVNQALMRSEVSVVQNGTARKLPPGQHELKEITGVYHDKIGYILPVPATVQVSNQVEKGRWSDITDQKNIPTEEVRMEVFKLWFDHGVRPVNASYQYIVVPNVSEQELVSSSRNNRHIEILANTSDVQAVRHAKLDISQIAFYRAGDVKLANGLNVSMGSQGMAMLKMRGDQVQELTVSDPSRKLNKVLVTLSGTYNAKGEYFTTLPSADKASTAILVDLPKGVYAGKSVTVNLIPKL